MQDIFELSCFTLDRNGTLDPKKQALFTPSKRKLWSLGQTLKVSFDTDDMPAVKLRGYGFISIDNIIDWMNEWSMGANGCVPSFKKEDRFENGDIRVKFGGKMFHSIYNQV